MFPQYYFSPCFRADNLHDKIVMQNPPPDIQLFYIINVCQNLNALGITRWFFVATIVDSSVFDFLRSLGYDIDKTETGYWISW